MRLHIAMYVPGMAFNGNTLKTESLGGSETAALCLARELAALGNKVVVFANTDKPGVYDDVTYTTADRFLDYTARLPVDVAIVQRAPDVFQARNNAKLNILWQHDLALGRLAPQFNGVLWNVDLVAVVSNYMRDQYREVYGCDESVLWATRNGIDLDLFPEPLVRDRKKIMYCARPERGLDRMLALMPALLEADPEITLHVAGYNNPTQAFADLYADVRQKMDALGERCVWLGHLTKPELYRHYATAGVYAYPTPSPVLPGFREVSCITAMECMAAGLPIVTTPMGALPETIHPDAGSLVSQDKIVDAILRYVRDDAVFNAASEAGRKHAQSLSWASVAEEWQAKMEDTIAANNADAERLAVHLKRHGDLAAVNSIEQDDAKNDAALERWPDAFAMVPGQPRYLALKQSVSQHKDVLDFGCGLGLYGMHLARDLPETTITAFDRSEVARQKAKELATKHDSPVRVVDAAGSGHEAVFLLDVLSHVADPAAVLAEAEACVKPGGMVYVSVPFGPWGHQGAKRDPLDTQMWELTFQDLESLAGTKPDFDLYAIPGRFNEWNGSPLGWYFLKYRADGEPVGQLDVTRHRKLQRPQQTLSVNLMCGPNAEDTLEWCLKSVVDIADEIVIADTGMSAPGIEIAKRYGARMVPAPSPLAAGFETPRNIALSASRCDWVLWIDSDERLIDGHNIAKYLRENSYQGYGLRQHHFAVDTQFTPDMPVRLFRRRERGGRSMRFFGMIHEHPELELNAGPGPVIVLSDVHIAHVGYLTESVRQRRFWRNKPLLEKDKEKYPERMLQKHFIMRDNTILAGYLLEQRGRMDAEIAGLCRETVHLYREHFLGKPGYVNIDSIQYYSQALRILGEGVDVVFDINACRDGDPAPLSGSSLRFACKDDLMAELQWRAEAEIEPYLKESW